MEKMEDIAQHIHIFLMDSLLDIMEARVQRFHDLHGNKWFHVMNWVLDYMRSSPQQRWMLRKYGKEFYL
jgi:hypothetical protein